jgi:hypothetical protein
LEVRRRRLEDIFVELTGEEEDVTSDTAGAGRGERAKDKARA